MSSTSGINFTGLASGVDWQSIITQLISIEKQPVVELTQRRDLETARKALLDDIKTKLATLQTAADSVRDPTFWIGTPHGTSGDTDSFTVDVADGAPAASYQVQVKQLATGDVWAQAAQAGERRFSQTYGGSGVLADNTTLLTGLTNATGTSLGLAVGQTINVAGSQGGTAIAGTTGFTVTATSTLDDLKGWLQTQLPGSTVAIASGGRLQIDSPAGADQEITALSLSTGGKAGLFDGTFATSTATIAASGVGKIQANDTLHITAGSLTFDVAVQKGWTMQQVSQAILNANGNVQAGVVNGQLRISSKDTGATNGKVTITSTGTAVTDLGLSRTVTSASAVVNVDGVDMTSESNITTTLIPGATLTLKRSMTQAATATTDPKWVDPDEASKRVQTFVSAYNDVVTEMLAKVREKKVVPATTTADLAQGLLFNDSSVQSVIDSFRDAMSTAVGGLASDRNLAALIGISTGAPSGDSSTSQDSLDGLLQFDQSKFSQMFSTNRGAVQAIIGQNGGTSTTDGFAQRISDLANAFTSSGGAIFESMAADDANIKDMNDEIDAMNARIDQKQQILQTQFQAMEDAISQLQAGAGSLGATLLNQQNTSSSSSSSGSSSSG
jgi:flagellar hook-associated protein 2